MTASRQGAVYQAVSVMVGLRELATYEPVDTRAVCPSCSERCCVLWTISWPMVAGRKPADEQCCGRCWIERLG